MLRFFERNFLAIVILLSIGFFALADTEALGPGRLINFPGPNLERVIRDWINKPTGNIYESDLVRLAFLSVWSEGISDLSGLEYCTNLTTLWLGGNNISDISPLSHLTNLNALGLGDNNISDISALSGLTKLTDLELYDNNISDISALSGLTKLTDLELYDNNISDISALSGLTNLTDLGLHENNISDISPLSYLTSLANLWLWGNNISDISPLSRLTSLTWLAIDRNSITDISPLSRLTSLTWLAIDRNSITDISPLSHLTNLNELGVGGNNISDISPLSHLTNLNELGLYENNISDISPLSRLTSLTELWLYDNNISDISALSGLTNLTDLGLSSNNITDISALSGLTNLTDLGLSSNNITDISPLSRLTNLTSLGLGCNNISDISVLSGLTNLSDLGLGGNNASDISALSGLTNLTWLGLGVNNISDISPLSRLTNLTWIGLVGNNISDISSLSGLAKLTELWLGINNIRDIEALVNNPGLGTGDVVKVAHNYLDLSTGSGDMKDIQALINRGAVIEHEPQNDTPGNLLPVARASPDQTVMDTNGNGQEDVTLDGSGSTDPDGDPLSYSWTENGTQIATGINPTVTLSTGSHTITLTVTDDGTPSLTDTDEVVIIVAPPVHTVSTPTTPSGPSSGQVGDSLDFSTGGATCSQGHSLQYRFDWGDETHFNWSSATSASHSYSSAGTYLVKAQARCASDTSVVSGWSSGKIVTINGALSPKFLTLPFTDSNIRIQQGWRYTAPIGPNPDDPYAHNGIDYIMGEVNQAPWRSFDVVAASDGLAMQSSGGGYGSFVLIRHDETGADNRHYFTLYAHLDSVPSRIPAKSRWDTAFSSWTQVERGEKIGTAGATGVSNSSWVHLHFEVLRGGYAQNKTDPYDIYKARSYYPGSDNYTTCGLRYLWTTDPPSLPSPEEEVNCEVDLRGQDTSALIDTVLVNDSFDIYVGASSGNIDQVRFSSDEDQDSLATGGWTEWFEWDTYSGGDWNAETKTMSWTFTTSGQKEVCAEIRDGNGSSAKCFADISAQAAVDVVEERKTKLIGSIPLADAEVLGAGRLVNFPDPNLQQVIRDTIGKPTGNIYESDLVWLTFLGVWDRGISDLTGLEYCTNLISISLFGNNITNISALSGLTSLTKLDLNSNNISDISALSGLTNLTWLGLHDNNITDISALSHLTNLTWLWLCWSNISDISALSGLTNLTVLQLQSDNISDISALCGLTNLTRLLLDGSNISDISPLSHLTNLTELWLHDNNITDISALSRLANLTELWLYDNNITDISALSHLTNLTELWLHENSISDISALSGLTNLTQLGLGDNNISDISTLSHLTNLTWLGLHDNSISDISALSHLTNLTGLWLYDNNISDIEPLVNNPGLGAGDDVRVAHNDLDLSIGSDDMKNMQALIDRGVKVDEDEPWRRPPFDRFPFASAGPNQTITDADGDWQEDVALDGRRSINPYGNIAKWVWTESGNQIATGETPTIALSVGRHTITLIVIDDEGATDTDDVLITVQQARNKLLVASAGSDQTLTDTDSNGSEKVTLNGSGSEDPDGSIVSWVWTKGGSQIATGINPTVTLSVGTHTITLKVTDNDGATDTDEVRIVITSIHTVSTPTTPSGPPSGEVNELLEFSTSKSTCSKGHPVEYQFNWDSAGEDDLSEWSSLTSASHSYSTKGTYQVEARARCASGTSVESGWSAPKTVIIGPLSDEHAPTASAPDITGQPEIMHPDTFYTVTAKYYDADGRDDLNTCYLRLNRPSKPLTMMWYQADGHAASWAGEEGEEYITTVYTIFNKIDDGYQIAWSFRLNDKWPEIENAIGFGVFASDDSGLSSGDWEYDDANASFILERTGIVTGTVTGWVTDAVTGEGIVGAVLLLDPDPLTYSPLTGHNGRFSFSVPASTYSITTSVMDYEPQSRSGITIVAEEWTELDFSLTLKKLPIGEDKFEIGDRVKVDSTGAIGLRLRKDNQGEPAEDVEKVVPNGWLFEITGGPFLTEDHTWWQVKEETYESSPVTNGWVAEEYLIEIAVDRLVPYSPPQYFTLSSAQDKVTVALQRAREWAREAKPNWIELCLKFVRDVYESQTGWYSCTVAQRDLGTRFYSVDTCRNPVKGAMVFFSSPYPEGHVGVYLGNNEVVNIGADGKPHSQSLVEVGKAIGTYRGWAYPPYDWVRYFRIGDGIETTGPVNVRSQPGEEFAEISDPDYPGVAPAGTSGVVMDGPERTFNADGTTQWIWWRVSFEDGYEGWSIQNRLVHKTDNLN